MERIGVTARFDEGGKVTPLNFTWQGRVYLVDSTGRRWQDEFGEHILTMVPGGRVFELIYHPGEGAWYLKPVGPGSTTA
jgi:hypothetical protein